MRWIRGTLAALTLLLAIFGIPCALLMWGSYPTV